MYTFKGRMEFKHYFMNKNKKNLEPKRGMNRLRGRNKSNYTNQIVTWSNKLKIIHTFKEQMKTEQQFMI